MIGMSLCTSANMMNMNMTRPTDIVNYRPSWQRLRCSTLREHNPYGGMLTPEGATDAINRMTNYINDASGAVTDVENVRMRLTTEEEHACRVRRVYSFLQATVNGLISQPGLNHMQQVRAHMVTLQPQMDLALVQKAANKWNWDVVRFELETMWREDRMWYVVIYNDMKERLEEKGKTAPSMMHFIGLMNEVNSLGGRNG